MLNAVATKYEQKYFIGIYIGTIFLITDYFSKIFSYKSIIPQYGNSDAEKDDKKTIDVIINGGGTAYDFANPQPVFPEDETRMYYAKMYMKIAFEFLLYHELAHIIRGHVGYSSHEFGVEWLEIFSRGQEGINPLFRQTCEMDADSFAVNHAVINAKILQEHYNSHKETLPIFYKSVYAFVIDYTFIIYSLFKLWGFQPFNELQAKAGSHPPSSVRISMLTGNIFTLLEQYKLGNEVIFQQIPYAMLDAERAFAEVTYAENDPKLFLDNHIMAGDYVQDIMKNWNSVRPQIEPFAFGNLPPLVLTNKHL